MSSTTTRSYHQVARAAATERTQQRIGRAFFDMLRTKWLDEITLDAVAGAADTTRQTVIRLFGGKDGLMAAAAALAHAEITGRRRVPDGAPVAQIANILVADYDIQGDMIIRLLAQESQHRELTPMLNEGRAGHRAFLTETFETELAGLPKKSRDRLLNELVAVTDVYVWKLFRRDFGHSAAEVTRLIARLLEKVLLETRQ